MKKYQLRMCVRGGSQNGTSGFLLQFDYNEQLVEELKHIIPHVEREWRPEEKTWWVSETHASKLVRLFSNFEALIYLQQPLFGDGWRRSDD